ncbi:hypothetical protein E5D57_005288 [Metarhizium anisopliae]|nr:hypothetical protein E5D57_005288 [Metarhizium anisopliae]
MALFSPSSILQPFTDLTSWESASLFSLPVDRDRGKVVSAAMSALHRDPDELLTGCKLPGFQTKPVGRSVYISPLFVAGPYGYLASHLCHLDRFCTFLSAGIQRLEACLLLV